MINTKVDCCNVAGGLMLYWIILSRKLRREHRYCMSTLKSLIFNPLQSAASAKISGLIFLPADYGENADIL